MPSWLASAASVRCFDFSLQFIVYSLQMITLQAQIIGNYTLMIGVYRSNHL